MQANALQAPEHSPLQSAAGHFWTVYGHLRSSVRRPPAWRPWSIDCHDPLLGQFQLTGHWSEAEGATEAVVLIHGLGGNSNSGYLRRMSQLARQRGLSVLHLNLRGADRRGPDLYHAGQWEDVEHCLRAPELRAMRRIHLIGYSLGGHVALRSAASCSNPRLGRIVSICGPIDLARASHAFSNWPPLYSSHVMRSLRASYRNVAERWRMLNQFEAPTVAEVNQFRTIRQWDERIVAPRNGYGSAAEYYAAQSAGNYLTAIRRETLIIATDFDPMVPLHTLVEALRNRSAQVKVRRIAQGGHLGFPLSVQPRVDNQVLDFVLGSTC